MRVSQIESSFLFLPSWFTLFFFFFFLFALVTTHVSIIISPSNYFLAPPISSIFSWLFFFSRPNRNQSTLINPIRYYVLYLPYRSSRFPVGQYNETIVPSDSRKNPPNQTKFFEDKKRIKETFINVCVLLDGPQIAVAAPSNIRILMRGRVDGLIASVSWWPSQRHTARKERKKEKHFVSFCFFIGSVGRREGPSNLFDGRGVSFFFSFPGFLLFRFRQSDNPFPFAEHI